MTEQVFDVALAMLVLGVGAWSMLAGRITSAVIIFIVYGLLLSLVWVRIAAIDVALTEAAIGSGATGMLLIAAAYKTGRESGARETVWTWTHPMRPPPSRSARSLPAQAPISAGGGGSPWWRAKSVWIVIVRSRAQARRFERTCSNGTRERSTTR